MNALKSIYRRIAATKRCSPGGFVLWAASLAVLFAVLHLLGFREYASVLSGTVPLGAFNLIVNRFFAVVYVLLYLGAVILAPILLIGAAVFLLLERWLSHRKGRAR